MIDSIWLIAILVFCGTILFSLGVYYYADSRKEHSRILNRIIGVTREVSLVAPVNIDTRNYGFPKKQLLGIASFFGNRIKPRNEGEITRIRKTFLQAGFRRHNVHIIFYGVKTCLSILLPLCFFMVKVAFIRVIPSLHFMLICIALALAGFYLPNLWLRFRVMRRRNILLKGFPDALDLMVVCVEAGMALDSAVSRVGEEMRLSNKALSEEFKQVSLELRAGMPRRDALRNLAVRTDLEDVNSLVGLLIQTDKFGTSVAQALRVYSDTMRTKRAQRAEEMAAKMPVKLMIPLILFIFPSILVTIIGPAAIKILRYLLPRFYGQ